MSGLPSGWAKATLGDVAVWGSGGTPSRSEPSFYGGQIPWIKSGELNGRYVKTTEETITEAAVNGSNAKIFPAGSVAIAMYGATIGKTAILGVDAATNQACAVGIPIEGLIDTEFLYRLLQNEKDAFIEKGKGGAQPNISQAVIKAHEVILPPLAEQTRIATKLDELLAQVDTLKACIDGIPALLKRFRQSVLAAAVSGRLTEEWRALNNLQAESFQQSSPPLYEMYSDDLFSPPSNWHLTALGNVASFQQGLQIAKSERRTSPSKDSLPILRTVNYENQFKDDVHYAEITGKSIIAEMEDIILSRTGTVGRVLTGHRGIMHNNSFRINYRDDVFIRGYLIYFLRSPLCQGYIKRRSGRSSQPDLTHKEFSKCPALVPPISEQKEIVQRVEQLFAFADQLEAKISEAKTRIDRLTQSILAKAFRGELVPQDPDDEPASALLERIQAQRASAPKAKRKRRVGAD